jgi:hypothetical protein
MKKLHTLVGKAGFEPAKLSWSQTRPGNLTPELPDNFCGPDGNRTHYGFLIPRSDNPLHLPLCAETLFCCPSGIRTPTRWTKTTCTTVILKDNLRNVRESNPLLHRSRRQMLIFLSHFPIIKNPFSL